MHIKLKIWDAFGMYMRLKFGKTRYHGENVGICGNIWDAYVYKVKIWENPVCIGNILNRIRELI